MKLPLLMLRRVVEALFFGLLAIVFFNMIADFSAHAGVVVSPLSPMQAQILGMLSLCLAALNARSSKFFGFALAR
jgi:hypothetical protein